MAAGRRARRTATSAAAGLPRREIRFRDVRSPTRRRDERPVLDGFDLTIPAGTSLAIVGQNGAGKTTLAKLLCRLYDPQRRRDRDRRRRPARRSTSTAWRGRVTAVFQDFIRYELPLRDNVAPRRRAGRGRRGRAATRPAAPTWPTSTRPGPRLRGRHRPLRRAVAAHRAGPRAVRGARSAPASCCSTSRPRSSTCAARPRSSSGSSPPPRLHDDPDLAPLLDRAPRRPHLRASRTAGSSSSARTTS